MLFFSKITIEEKLYTSKEYLSEQLNKKMYIKIAKENRVDPSTVRRYMRKHGLVTKKRKFWSKEGINVLKAYYALNPNVYDIFPNRSISSVNHKASRLGLKRKFRKRKYSVDRNFFKRRSPEWAYIVGLFFSDGNVSYDKQNISIHLNQKDHYILEKISKLMGSNRPVTVCSNASNLRIDSTELANDLIKFGCTPRKSKTLRFPDISDEFLPSFIRGYFDGDGSIHFNKPNTIKVSFVSTFEFLEEMQFRLKKVLNIKKNPIKRVKSVWRIHYYGNDARKLCDWMYKNSKDLYLKRKKDRFDKHLRLRKNGNI